MTKFLNYYFCKQCDTAWTDEWDCQCDDECPSCGTDHEPYKSEDLEDED